MSRGRKESLIEKRGGKQVVTEVLAGGNYLSRRHSAASRKPEDICG